MSVFSPNFGSLDSLADFSDLFPDTTDQDINRYFLERGYTRNVNIRAASYDWRLGAGEANAVCTMSLHFQFHSFTCRVYNRLVVYVSNDGAVHDSQRKGHRI